MQQRTEDRHGCLVPVEVCRALSDATQLFLLLLALLLFALLALALFAAALFIFNAPEAFLCGMADEARVT